MRVREKMGYTESEKGIKRVRGEMGDTQTVKEIKKMTACSCTNHIIILQF